MLASVTAMLALTLGVGAPESPNWESDYGKALRQTKEEGRPLLVVIDKPGEKKEAVDPELMSEPQQMDLLKAYDLCHVDATTSYGKKVAKAFQAKAFPHVAIIDKSGSVILHTHVGKMSDATWESALERHQAGVVPHQVMKPISTTTVNYQSPVEASAVSEGTPVHSTPVSVAPSYSAPAMSFPSQPYYNNSYCPNCQKGY